MQSPQGQDVEFSIGFPLSALFCAFHICYPLLGFWSALDLLPWDWVLFCFERDFIRFTNCMKNNKPYRISKTPNKQTSTRNQISISSPLWHPLLGFSVRQCSTWNIRSNVSTLIIHLCECICQAIDVKFV